MYLYTFRQNLLYTKVIYMDVNRDTTLSHVIKIIMIVGSKIYDQDLTKDL